jgi:hypothetical protein
MSKHPSGPDVKASERMRSSYVSRRVTTRNNRHERGRSAVMQLSRSIEKGTPSFALGILGERAEMGCTVKRAESPASMTPHEHHEH